MPFRVIPGGTATVIDPVVGLPNEEVFVMTSVNAVVVP
jgi:hypothetical protein